MTKVVKYWACYYVMVATLVILLFLITMALANWTPHIHSNDDGKTTTFRRRGADTFDQVAGSRLPNCLHACGSCTPCRLVMVHLGCSSSLAEAETCPMAYKCMCNNKSYPVP